MLVLQELELTLPAICRTVFLRQSQPRARQSTGFKPTGGVYAGGTPDGQSGPAIGSRRRRTAYRRGPMPPTSWPTSRPTSSLTSQPLARREARAAILCGAALVLAVLPAAPARAAAGCGTPTLQPLAEMDTGDYRIAYGADALRLGSMTFAGRVNQSGDDNPMVVRWDGTQLRREPVRQREIGRDAEFQDVTVVKGGKGWAVGSYGTDFGPRPLLRTRVKGVWRVTEPPALRGKSALNGAVDASSDDNVWAVGYQRAGRKPAVIRWNGTRWRTMRLPLVADANRHSAVGVDAVSKRNVWISTVFTKGGVTRAGVYHWNGQRFVRHVLPQPSGSFNAPTAIAVGSANNIWVAGTSLDGGAELPSFWHFDGADWSHIEGPLVGAVDHTIYDAVVVKGRLMAVGFVVNAGDVAVLIRSTKGGTDLSVSAPSADPGVIAAIGLAEGTNVVAAGGTVSGNLATWTNCSSDG